MITTYYTDPDYTAEGRHSCPLAAARWTERTDAERLAAAAELPEPDRESGHNHALSIQTAAARAFELVPQHLLPLALGLADAVSDLRDLYECPDTYGEGFEAERDRRRAEIERLTALLAAGLASHSVIH